MTAMMNRTAHMGMAEARREATALMREHGLLAFGWTVVFDNAKKRAGQCNYRLQTISLSKYLLAQRSYEDTMMTITHEIAHALVGGGHGHDAVWARKHRELGGNGKRCFEHVDNKSPWVGICAKGKEYPRYRQPKRLQGWSCKCGGSLPHSLTWHRR